MEIKSKNCLSLDYNNFCYNNDMEKLKILIIEDDTIIAMQLENIVSQMGHNIAGIAKNSEEALKFSFETIDLIISDINIQGDIDGIETSKIISQKYNSPIIFITAYKDIQTLQKASKVDYAGYIVKPFREDEIETLVNLTILKYQLPINKVKLVINETYSYSRGTKELFKQNIKIDLTKKEIALIELFIASKNKFVSYKNIELHIWGEELVSSETRRKFLYRFKKKLPNFPLILKKNQGFTLSF